MIHSIISWLVATIGSLGYTGIVLLMALESSFFPFPSEVVMIPAGYLAHQGEMNVWLAILAGIVGSLIGAWVNYLIARVVGRAALLRWGHRIFLPNETFFRVERYLREHGEIGTFVGRLIPVVRQYISFPAGLVHMSPLRFTLFTALGAGLWSGVLVAIGYIAGQNQERISALSHTALFWVLGGCALLIIGYWKFKKRTH